LFGQSFTQMDGHLDDELPGEYPVGHTHIRSDEFGE
jgi:hypothetical protein